MDIQSITSGVSDLAERSLGLGGRPLTSGDLIARAQRRSGLHDFGGVEFLEGLEVFLSACEREASLNLIGRITTRWDVVRFLSNLLRLRAAESRSPDILAERIEQPIFLTGLPRSGTTFLHSLLMLDENSRVPRIWQAIHPYPLARDVARGRDRRRRMVDRQLWMFQRLAPEFRNLHPVNASSPQECSELNAHVFASLRFDTTYDIPSYREWLDARGHLEAYRFHKRFLQHLQHQAGPGQWVLKCPDHVFAIRDIRAVYPDARFVFLHRDPLKVLPSVARLTEMLRRPFTKRIDRARIGAQESQRWLEGTARMMAESEQGGQPEPILHVRYAELVADPLATIRKLYAHFGLALTPATARRIAESTARRPNGGYGANAYRFEDHGFDPASERERFAAYMRHFDVEQEVGGERGFAGARYRLQAPEQGAAPK